jgi:hypothetical protein
MCFGGDESNCKYREVVMSRSRTHGRNALFFLAWILLLVTLPTGCSDDTTGPKLDPEPEPSEIHVDDGYLGVVVDARSIFRKGIFCETVDITFENQPSRNTTLPVDAITNLAILSFDTDDLTDDEFAAFGAGVPATLTIKDAGEALIAEIDIASLVLDSRNIPLVIGTDMESTRQPVALRDDMPYLLQYIDSEGVVEQSAPAVIYFHSPYDHNNVSQQFYFKEVEGQPYVYNVSVTPGTYPYRVNWVEDESKQVIADIDDWYPLLPVTMEQDEQGWVEIRVAGTDDYLYNSDDYALFCGPGYPGKFRLICDRIQWSVIDRGTTYNQPIMPPARLDFAYSVTLRNCSSGGLVEEVGFTKSRTYTTEFETMESLQLFASSEETFNVKIGLSVTAKVGLDIKGIGEAGEELTVSEEVSMGYNYTNSQTTTSQQTWKSSVSRTKEVSRKRTTTVKEYTAVEVYDAVKTIDDVIIPFTQVLRIQGMDKDTSELLTGEEIRSQMLFNFAGGVITAVGADYVDMTLRGRAIVDQLFEATTNQEEIVGACD